MNKSTFIKYFHIVIHIDITGSLFLLSFPNAVNTFQSNYQHIMLHIIFKIFCLFQVPRFTEENQNTISNAFKRVYTKLHEIERY